MKLKDNRILNVLDNYYRNKHGRFIAGVDEAGRGPLAGPVVAGIVIMPNGHFKGIDDSKKLSEKKREEQFEIIKEKAISYSIGVVDNKEIDRINILNATKKAMKIALSKLRNMPDCILSDAVKFDTDNIPLVSIVKGDKYSLNIAAASILAKVHRDRLMTEYSYKYPEYNFKKHKGYPTKEHITLLKQFGISPIHRRSYKPVNDIFINTPKIGKIQIY